MWTTSLTVGAATEPRTADGELQQRHTDGMLDLIHFCRRHLGVFCPDGSGTVSTDRRGGLQWILLVSAKTLPWRAAWPGFFRAALADGLLAASPPISPRPAVQGV